MDWRKYNAGVMRPKVQSFFYIELSKVHLQKIGIIKYFIILICRRLCLAKAMLSPAQNKTFEKFSNSGVTRSVVTS